MSVGVGRRAFLLGPGRPDERGAARLEVALAAGDPYNEVGCAWAAGRLLADICNADDRIAARAALGRFFDWVAEVDVVEVTRLATTVDRWRHEVLA